MRRAEHVAYLLDRMAEASGNTPVSVKCRIGVHDTSQSITDDAFEVLHRFVTTVTASGSCSRVVVHARSAVLQGLSPGANRSVPPLRHDLVLRLAAEMPHLQIVINGGVTPNNQSFHDSGLSGLMSGRWCLARPLDLPSALNMKESNQGSIARAAIAMYCRYAELELSALPREEWPDLFAPLAIAHHSLQMQAEDENSSPEQTSYAIDMAAHLADCASGLASAILRHRFRQDDTPTMAVFGRTVAAICGKKCIAKLRANV